MERLRGLIGKAWSAIDFGWPEKREILAVELLAPLGGRYLPLSRWSLRPSAVVAILNEIVINRRSCIVECGAGTSTFYIARLLRERGGGRLYSIEHDAEWARWVEDGLAAEGLDAHTSVSVAPLSPTPLALERNLWYDAGSIGWLASDLQIDLLLVDGPPAVDRETELARYPAIPYFRQALAEDFAVVLDDIQRTGERKVVARWEQELGVDFDRRAPEGIAIGHSRPSQNLGLI